ncbi:MAG: Rieske (2Fe-2S) protein [Bacteroidales bacterium]|nr:Rieske (2Fe-2S) protein [Bacteroidales bacterium]
MQANKSITRKQFLRQLSWLIALPYALFAGLSFKQNARINRPKDIRIPLEINKGITFRDGLIIVKEDNKTQFLSAKCTHLGCNIHSVENNELVCPCYGSRFSLSGECIKGPAKEGLHVFEFDIYEIENDYVVKINC